MAELCRAWCGGKGIELCRPGVVVRKYGAELCRAWCGGKEVWSRTM